MLHTGQQHSLPLCKAVAPLPTGARSLFSSEAEQYRSGDEGEMAEKILILKIILYEVKCGALYCCT